MIRSTAFIKVRATDGTPIGLFRRRCVDLFKKRFLGYARNDIIDTHLIYSAVCANAFLSLQSLHRHELSKERGILCGQAFWFELLEYVLHVV